MKLIAWAASFIEEWLDFENHVTNMECKQCSNARALARKNSPVFKDTHVNIECATHMNALCAFIIVLKHVNNQGEIQIVASICNNAIEKM